VIFWGTQVGNFYRSCSETASRETVRETDTKPIRNHHRRYMVWSFHKARAWFFLIFREKGSHALGYRVSHSVSPEFERDCVRLVPVRHNRFSGAFLGVMRAIAAFSLHFQHTLYSTMMVAIPPSSTACSTSPCQTTAA
jgi:hypothetical protein